MNKKHVAFLFGLFETGLGVARSLGREGIPVIGLDYKKDIAWYSKYVTPFFCPNPNDEDEFLLFIIDKAKKLNEKPIIFITADDYLPVIIKNKELLEDYFLFNLPDWPLLESIKDKYKQFKLAQKAQIPVPSTIKLNELKENPQLIHEFSFPLFLKGEDSTEWRTQFGGSKKGFVINAKEELMNLINSDKFKDIGVIIQEMVFGPDTNHYKFNGYVDKNGYLRAGFCLQKIRQNPIHYGVGCLVESIFNKELLDLGMHFFDSIGYKGVGSAEFKLDEKDGQYKLIELNPRYWQQNYLSTACGINFPLIQYLDVTNQLKGDFFEYKPGIKWVNIYTDFDSYLDYRKVGSLNFREWIRSLKGPKVFSDWAKDDIKPGFYEIRFGKRLIHIPKFLLKKILN